MVKFRVKANQSGQYYFPKEVREELGEELNVICNAKVAVIYNSQTSLELVLKSLKVLTHDLEHRRDLEKDEKNQKAWNPEHLRAASPLKNESKE